MSIRRFTDEQNLVASAGWRPHAASTKCDPLPQLPAAVTDALMPNGTLGVVSVGVPRTSEAPGTMSSSRDKPTARVAPSKGSSVTLSTLAKSVAYDLLPEGLAVDLFSSVSSALEGGTVFEYGSAPLHVFQHAVDGAVRDIRRHPRGQLLQRLVTQGPYEREGAFPAELMGSRLTDEETAKAIRFVFSWMVNSFQGRLAELLAAGPILDVLAGLKSRGEVPESARVFMGDVVTAPRVATAGHAKAADIHILTVGDDGDDNPRVLAHALGEIKSYAISERLVRRQLCKHIERSRSGLIVRGRIVEGESITFAPDPPIVLWVEPTAWSLPRRFRFEKTDGRVFLHIDAPQTPTQADELTRLDDGSWRVRLRWSHEALAAAAFGLTFWFMERVGEVAFAESAKSPWPEMSPADAGRNAATQSLYYAILRARSRHERGRAIALYNMYGFGYALGMNFRAPDGQRRMLWAQDLREILREGATRDGCTIWS